MSPRRGDRAAPPPLPGEYDLRFASNDGAAGWEQLAAQAAGNLRRAFDSIRADPRSRMAPERQHRLKGSLGTGTWKARHSNAGNTRSPAAAGSGISSTTPAEPHGSRTPAPATPRQRTDDDPARRRRLAELSAGPGEVTLSIRFATSAQCSGLRPRPLPTSELLSLTVIRGQGSSHNSVGRVGQSARTVRRSA